MTTIIINIEIQVIKAINFDKVFDLTTPKIVVPILGINGSKFCSKHNVLS